MKEWRMGSTTFNSIHKMTWDILSFVSVFFPEPCFVVMSVSCEVVLYDFIVCKTCLEVSSSHPHSWSAEIPSLERLLLNIIHQPTQVLSLSLPLMTKSTWILLMLPLMKFPFWNLVSRVVKMLIQKHSLFPMTCLTIATSFKATIKKIFSGFSNTNSETTTNRRQQSQTLRKCLFKHFGCLLVVVEQHDNFIFNIP